MDTIGITMPISKHSYQAMDPSEIPQMIRSSFYIARTGRPGPVVVDMPKDVQEGDLDYPENTTIEPTGLQTQQTGGIPSRLKRHLNGLKI